MYTRVKISLCTFMCVLQLHIVSSSAAATEVTRDLGANLFPDIRKLDDERYIAAIPGRNLYLVMERLTSANIDKWYSYLKVQHDVALASGMWGSLVYLQQMVTDQTTKIRENTRGSEPALGVLEDGIPGYTPYLDRPALAHAARNGDEKWIAYITTEPNERISYYRPKIPQSREYIVGSGPFYYPQSREDIVGPENTNAHIKMFMTVTSSTGALVTTHLGIARSIEDTISKLPTKNVSMCLHKFAAQVMLMRNPELRYMFNRPYTEMAKILKKVMPKSALFLGTKDRLVSPENPPLLDYTKVDGKITNYRVFKKDQPNEVDFEMKEDGPYNWLFREAFSVAGINALCDLPALANLVHYEPLDTRIKNAVEKYDLPETLSILNESNEFPNVELCRKILVYAAQSYGNVEINLAVIRKILTQNSQAFDQSSIDKAFERAVQGSVNPKIVQFLLSSTNISLKPSFEEIKIELKHVKKRIYEARYNIEYAVGRVEGTREPWPEFLEIEQIVETYLASLGAQAGAVLPGSTL
ncbi:MAG: hypothetical protein V4482_06085 [Pseudomonadota bacterium]